MPFHGFGDPNTSNQENNTDIVQHRHRHHHHRNLDIRSRSRSVSRTRRRQIHIDPRMLDSVLQNSMRGLPVFNENNDDDGDDEPPDSESTEEPARDPVVHIYNHSARMHNSAINPLLREQCYMCNGNREKLYKMEHINKELENMMVGGQFSKYQEKLAETVFEKYNKYIISTYHNILNTLEEHEQIDTIEWPIESILDHIKGHTNSSAIPLVLAQFQILSDMQTYETKMSLESDRLSAERNNTQVPIEKQHTDHNTLNKIHQCSRTIESLLKSEGMLQKLRKESLASTSQSSLLGKNNTATLETVEDEPQNTVYGGAFSLILNR